MELVLLRLRNAPSPGELSVTATHSPGNEGHRGWGQGALWGQCHVLGMFCPCCARLVPADSMQAALPTAALRCEQMPSTPNTFQGIASHELHRTSCQQLCLSCRLTLLQHSWLLLFFPLSVSFFKSALTSEPGSVAHLRCWRVTSPVLLLVLTALVRLWAGSRAFSISHGTTT